MNNVKSMKKEKREYSSHFVVYYTNGSSHSGVLTFNSRNDLIKNMKSFVRNKNVFADVITFEQIVKKIISKERKGKIIQFKSKITNPSISNMNQKLFAKYYNKLKI